MGSLASMALGYLVGISLVSPGIAAWQISPAKGELQPRLSRLPCLKSL
jgi:hypothetical protein